jgi:hypothetical protein
MRDYWRGLLALRMSKHGEVFRVADVPEGHYRWLTPPEGNLLGYVVGGQVLVLANCGTADGVFELDLPDGSWRQVGSQDRVDHVHGVEGDFATLKGEAQIPVPAGSFLIWVRDTRTHTHP